MTIRQLMIAGAALALLAGCGGGGEDAPAPQPSEAVTGGPDDLDWSVLNEAQRAALLPDEPTPAPAPTPSATRSPVDTAPGPIPIAFRGSWSSAVDQCGPRDQMRLDVRPGDLRFYESVATPTNVERLSEDRVRMRLDVSGEGQSWSETAILTLLPDGRLRREQADMAPVTYRRCPQ